MGSYFFGETNFFDGFFEGEFFREKYVVGSFLGFFWGGRSIFFEFYVYKVEGIGREASYFFKGFLIGVIFCDLFWGRSFWSEVGFEVEFYLGGRGRVWGY